MKMEKQALITPGTGPPACALPHILPPAGCDLLPEPTSNCVQASAACRQLWGAANTSNRPFSLLLERMGFLKGNGIKGTLLSPCGAISSTDPRPPTPGWSVSARPAAQQQCGYSLYWTWPPEDATGPLPGQLTKIWQNQSWNAILLWILEKCPWSGQHKHFISSRWWQVDTDLSHQATYDLEV